MCFSDAAYVIDNPPPQVRQFWDAEHPGISSPDRLRALVSTLGYSLIDDFWMPRDGWNAYYMPVSERIDALAPAWDADEDARRVLGALRDEIELYRKYSDTYGYYFLVIQKRRA